MVQIGRHVCKCRRVICCDAKYFFSYIIFSIIFVVVLFCIIYKPLSSAVVAIVVRRCRRCRNGTVVRTYTRRYRLSLPCKRRNAAIRNQKCIGINGKMHRQHRLSPVECVLLSRAFTSSPHRPFEQDIRVYGCDRSHTFWNLIKSLFERIQYSSSICLLSSTISTQCIA